jgi:hypothetical protein
MKAIKYQVKIYDGVLSWTHGFGKIIEEIFIPEKEIGFNIDNGRLNVFKTDEPRGKGGEINLDDTLVDKLVNLFELNERCYKIAQAYFKDGAKK